MTNRMIGVTLGAVLSGGVLWSCDDSIEGDFGDPVASVENSGSSSSQSTYEHAASTGKDGNAAPHYERAWNGITDKSRELVSTVNFDTIHYGGWRAPEGLSLGSYEDDLKVDLLIEASGYRSVDFGNEYDKGILMDLPHLTPMRISVRIMLLTARLRLDADDSRGGVEALVAAYRMASHTKNERVLISSLISMANFTAIQPLLTYAERSGALDTNARGALLAAIGPFRGDDALGFKAAIEGEQTITVGWVRDRLAQGDRNTILELFSMMSEVQQTEELTAIREAVERGDDLRSELQQWSQYFSQVHDAWDQPDAKAKIAKLDSTVKDGGFGQFAALLSPLFSNIYRQEVEGKQLVAKVVETLGH